MTICPCGSKLNYAACCGLYIEKSIFAPTPEALMRSRYTAYSQANIDYIMRTMKGAAAQDFSAEEAKAWALAVKWLGLQVLRSESHTPHGQVEFIASYSYQGQKQKLHEISDFLFEEGQWFYVDGKIL